MSVTLSKRLQAVTRLVPLQTRVCDSGCDHGFVSIYLIEQGIASSCIAMDINKGPLAGAAKHIREAGLSNQIETRLSDGVAALRKGEADTLILAGMGGRLVIKILTEAGSDWKGLRYLVLQPQSEIPLVRQYLREHGLYLQAEDMVLEDGKFYPMFRYGTEPSSCPRERITDCGEKKSVVSVEMADTYGRLLLEQRHPILLEYMKREKKIISQIQEKIRQEAVGEITEKAKELQHRYEVLMAALAVMG